MKLLIIFTFAVFAIAICESNELLPDNSNFLSDSLSGRIVNGLNAANGSFPWQVSINMSRSTQTKPSAFCGGAVISVDWVLTAAQCVNNYVVFYLGFGNVILNSPLITKVSRLGYTHPSYTASNFNYDVGLIKLPSRLVFNSNIQPILLARFSQATISSFIPAKTRVAGWGYISNAGPFSPNLKWIDPVTITNARCASFFPAGYIIPSSLCTEDPRRTKSICQGDTGGALATVDAGRWVHIGIASFVHRNGCSSGFPNGYTKTSYAVGWISFITSIPIRP